MFRSALIVAALSASAGSTSAFQASPTSSRQTVSLDMQKSNHKNNGLASLAVAGSIFASTLGFSAAPPAAVAAEAAAPPAVELSTGAIMIQAATKPGQSLIRDSVDVKDLLGSLIKNRKALSASVGRVSAVVQEELKAPVWAELTKEFLQFEGDVLPEVKVLPPRDIQQTIRDVSKGKLNLIVNGEIINLSVDSSSTSAQDEFVIRAKGVKGVAMPSFTEPAAFQARTKLQDQLDGVSQFWYSPLQVGPYELNNGDAVVGGTILAIGGAYGVSYAYYLSEQEAANKKLEENKKMLAEKKKAAAAKAKAAKKAEEEEEGSD